MQSSKTSVQHFKARSPRKYDNSRWADNFIERCKTGDYRKERYLSDYETFIIDRKLDDFSHNAVYELKNVWGVEMPATCVASLLISKSRSEFKYYSYKYFGKSFKGLPTKKMFELILLDTLIEVLRSQIKMKVYLDGIGFNFVEYTKDNLCE